MTESPGKLLILVRHWRIISLPCSSSRPVYLPVRSHHCLRMMSTVNCKWLCLPSLILGATIPHSGGLRKVRWSIGDRGKRGGVRAIYYWVVAQDQILMLFIYPKSEQDDLTP